MRLTILKDIATSGRMYKAGQNAEVQPMLAAQLIEMGAAAEFGTVQIEVPQDMPSGINPDLYAAMQARKAVVKPEPEFNEPQAEAVISVISETAEEEPEPDKPRPGRPRKK